MLETTTKFHSIFVEHSFFLCLASHIILKINSIPFLNYRALLVPQKNFILMLVTSPI